MRTRVRVVGTWGFGVGNVSLWESSDAVLVFSSEFLFSLVIAACFLPDEGGVVIGSVEHTVYFLLNVGLIVSVALEIWSLSREEEVAMYDIRRYMIPAGLQLLPEPFHCVRTLQSPHDPDRLGDGFVVTDFLDEVQQLTRNRSNTTAASEEDHVVESRHFPSHASIGTLQQSSICPIRSIFQRFAKSLASKAAERTKNKREVSILFTVLGRKVTTA